MWIALISLGIMLGDYIYHRWFQDQPAKPTAGRDIKVPSSTEGGVVPLYYGQCLVKSPVLAWWGGPEVRAGVDGYLFDASRPWLYSLSMFFVVGIGFSGFANVRLKNIYVGSSTLTINRGTDGGDELFTGYDGAGGTYYTFSPLLPAASTNGVWFTTTSYPLVNGVDVMGGYVQFLHGHPDQLMVDGSGNPLNQGAAWMLRNLVNQQEIPGYRGYTTIALTGMAGNQTEDVPLGFMGNWQIGSQAQPPTYAFEFISSPEGAGSGLFLYEDGSIDVNPMDVCYDLLTGTMGKLGLDPTRLDSTSMTRCAQTLANEGLGMSIAWDDGQDAKQYLDEVMQQIDGAYYEDPQTGKIVFKLIRADFDPTKLKEINPSNCSGLDNFAASGWTDVTNRVRVSYTDRFNGYVDGSVTDDNLGNSVGQTGEVRDIQIQFKGCNQQRQAAQLSIRELQARSRPLLKCRATVDGSFYRAVVGDPLILTWPDANISRVVMRVASVSRGTLKDGSIIIDLLQDYFYTHRNLPPVSIIEAAGGVHTIGDELP